MVQCSWSTRNSWSNTQLASSQHSSPPDFISCVWEQDCAGGWTEFPAHRRKLTTRRSWRWKFLGCPRPWLYAQTSPVSPWGVLIPLGTCSPTPLLSQVHGMFLMAFCHGMIWACGQKVWLPLFEFLIPTLMSIDCLIELAAHVNFSITES